MVVALLQVATNGLFGFITNIHHFLEFNGHFCIMLPNPPIVGLPVPVYVPFQKQGSVSNPLLPIALQDSFRKRRLDLVTPNLVAGEPSDLFKRVQQDEDPLAFQVPDILERGVAPSAVSVSPPPQEDIYIRLFGPDLKKVHFKQGDIGDCYLLAALDAILKHPAGDDILRTIKIEEKFTKGRHAKRYRVTFPTGDSVKVSASQVGKRRRKLSPVQGPVGIQLLELAYGKMIRPERNEGLDEPYPNKGRSYTPVLMNAGGCLEALQNLFGEASWKLTPGKQGHSTQTLSRNSNSRDRLKEKMEQVALDMEHYYLFTAATPDDLPRNQANHNVILLDKHWEGIPNAFQVRFEREHVYSVRAIDPVEQTITVADPHDTNRKAHQLSWDEFFKVFYGLYGISVPKTDTSGKGNPLAGKAS